MVLSPRPYTYLNRKRTKSVCRRYIKKQVEICTCYILKEHRLYSSFTSITSMASRSSFGSGFEPLSTLCLATVKSVRKHRSSPSAKNQWPQSFDRVILASLPTIQLFCRTTIGPRSFLRHFALSDTFKKITRQLDLPLFGLGYSPCTIEHQTI